MDTEFNDKQKWLDAVNFHNLTIKYWVGGISAYDDDGVCVGDWYNDDEESYLSLFTRFFKKLKKDASKCLL